MFILTFYIHRLINQRIIRISSICDRIIDNLTVCVALRSIDRNSIKGNILFTKGISQLFQIMDSLILQSRLFEIKNWFWGEKPETLNQNALKINKSLST